MYMGFADKNFIIEPFLCINCTKIKKAIAPNVIIKRCGDCPNSTSGVKKPEDGIATK